MLSSACISGGGRLRAVVNQSAPKVRPDVTAVVDDIVRRVQVAPLEDEVARPRGLAEPVADRAQVGSCLGLVGGEPFSKLRKDGWAWLFDQDRIHEVAEHVIVDTATSSPSRPRRLLNNPRGGAVVWW